MTDEQRSVRVEALARVEGEGALDIDVRDGEVTGVRLNIYEPPRFFEAFLRGRHHAEPVDITARVCGICPVAYQMSACAAIENALGASVDGPIAELRRLLYCGEWIESHALHIHLLHAPDFLGYEGGIEMGQDHRAELVRGLDLKAAGNQLVELIGGRAIHPVNIRLGGFHRTPRRRELRAFLPRLEQARDQAIEVVRWVAGFDFPEATGAWELAALRQPGRYGMTGGQLVSTDGLDLDPAEFADALEESHVEHSTALHSTIAGTPYLFGALARYALNAGDLTPVAASEAARAGLGTDERNPHRSIVARAVEVLEAVEEAIGIIESYEEPDAPWIAMEPRAGAGSGWTEAPRGLLWHHYVIDEAGLLTDARIVPPTAQNQSAIEDDLRTFAERNLHLPDAELALGAERVIRNHDPCISCATHFLTLRVHRS